MQLVLILRNPHSSEKESTLHCANNVHFLTHRATRLQQTLSLAHGGA